MSSGTLTASILSKIRSIITACTQEKNELLVLANTIFTMHKSTLLLYSIEYNTYMYVIKYLPEFAHWLDGLKDPMTRARLVRRLEKVSRGLLGDVEPVGEGVSEMREHYGSGWRMYYVSRGNTLIVMLGGGDKSTQRNDITKAIALSRTIEE